MTDVERLMNQDSREKKNIAHSAAKRKCGKKSKKCRLPHDGMTEAQLRKENGPVETWKLNKRYLLDEYRQMPVDIRRKYISHLGEMFDISYHKVARVFGCGDITAKKQLDADGIFLKIKKTSRETKAQREKFAAFVEDGGVLAGGKYSGETANTAVDMPEESLPTAVTKTIVCNVANDIQPAMYTVAPLQVGFKVTSADDLRQALDYIYASYAHSNFKGRCLRINVNSFPDIYREGDEDE